MVEDCTAALELDPHYVKALLRRAQANELLQHYDVALEGQYGVELRTVYVHFLLLGRCLLSLEVLRVIVVSGGLF